MDPDPVLYSFRRCPYAMRARLAIAASGVEVELREILLRDKPDEMLAASPKGTVPVLVKGDGDVIDESLDVAFWALEQNDPEGWLAPWQSKRSDADALIACNDGPFKHHLDRYKYASRYENADAETHRSEGAKTLADINDRLGRSGYLSGDRFSFLDAAIAPFIRQFRIADPDWFDAQSWPGLHGWLSGFLDRDDFKRIMKKYPLWKETGEAFRFPDAN